MRISRNATVRTSGVALAVLLLVALVLPASAQGARSVRGIDGNTIKVAGIGIVKQFPGAAVGAQARFQRANETNEVKGYKIDFTGMVDDNQDPATSLSEVRRLVTQEQVFALVPDVSQSNPGDYLNQQHVPYFGWAFDNTYCSPTPTTKLYGFGFNGCLVPSDPTKMPDAGFSLYPYVAKKTGKAHPTMAVFSNDTASGHNSSQYQSSAYQGAGFDVVYSKGVVPPPPVADYTPYVQELLKSDGGKAPDSILCLLQTDCIPIWNQLKAANYAGTYATFLYSDVLLQPMAGSVALINFQPLSSPTPGLKQMQDDVEAFKPGAVIDGGTATSYFAADMFISALKKAGKNPTPESVQKAAATQTWQIKGLAGPTIYPNATVRSYPACTAVVQDTGTVWEQLVPLKCSKKSYPVLAKFKQ